MPNVENKLINQLLEISGKGILDGEDADRKENLHRLFMYPAMMVPVTQSAILQAIKEVLPSTSCAIDPFMGSGTSLMSCMEFGLNVYGQDINPFAVLLTKAKTCFYDIDKLLVSIKNLSSCISNDESEEIDVSYYNLDKWFKKDVQIALSKIRRAILSEENSDFRKFFWVVMSETIRIGSNDRTSTFKLHQRSASELVKRNVNVIKEFFTLAKRSVEDLKLYTKKLADEGHLHDCCYKGKAVIKWGNTQKSIMTDDKFDLLVSSPPYGDNLTTVTYRSGTSIGANISEAQHAQSKADFLSKMTIASKEANETQYWLRLLHDNGYINDAMFTSINKDMERILYKIIAIVKSTKENLNR